jgi:predicted nucleic acid-binding protein
VILVDTGPLVALFDPRDGAHDKMRQVLAGLREALSTTVPVLSETFHLLGPGSRGSAAVREFVGEGGLGVWHLSEPSLTRCFELMDRYADHPMDLADASLVTAAETLRTTTVFTLDRNDFATYRIRMGRTFRSFTVIGGRERKRGR